MRVISKAQTGVSLLRNGRFEKTNPSQLIAWEAQGRGFQTDPAGRLGGQSIRCENAAAKGESGARQTLPLNRKALAPLSVRGWSKAENVSGSPDTGYSLYVDILYDDGTPLWGQTAAFRCGTHNWEKREFLIFPAKPVKSLTLYALFRGHAGKVWFDDLAVEELAPPAGGALVFQGVPVALPGATAERPPATKPNARLQNYRTADGLALATAGDRVTSLRLDGRELFGPVSAARGPAAAGFFARDVATESDFYPFEQGECAELGLSLRAAFTAHSNHVAVEGRIRSTTPRDRAVTLVFALPITAQGWRWGDDIRHSRSITGNGEYANTVAIRCGSTGTLSLYPLAAIDHEQSGVALAIDMAQPAQYRLFYHAATGQLCLAYDFGLAPETDHFPNAAEFRFVLYRFEPAWGFRAAFQKLVDIFPQYFACRTPEQGIWMPFTDISRVQDWEDFGFKFHEGNNNVPFDDAHGILSFRYTEPMTWWMPMPKGVPRDFAQALRARDQLAEGANAQARRLAAVSQVAAMSDEAGQRQLLFRNEPWCDGAVWSLNPNPHLPGALNAASVHWNEALQQQLYGPQAKGRLDGEYLDSLEGYVTADLNFRREHFHYTTVPLTFATETRRPALFKGLAVFEFTRWFCDEVHRLNKLTFANGVPYRFTFLCPWLDVMGTETDWLRGRQYAPASDIQLSLWRTMSYQKPYLLLMNTFYDRFTPDMVEKYFQRSLFYGVFPSMFSHNAAENPYWQNPKWYHRDRPLFKKYLPIIRRIAEAGWQPVTRVRCDNPNLLVERFGPNAQGEIYFTLLNDSAQAQGGRLQVETRPLGLPPQVRGQELISGESLPANETGFRIHLDSQQALAMRLTR